MWEDEYGNIFDNEEEARDDARANMDLDDYYSCGIFDGYTLLKLLFKYSVEDEELNSLLLEAEETYFDEWYHELEEEGE